MALERNDAKVMSYVVFKAGTPTEVAAKGTLCIDTANGKLYINTDGDDTWLDLSLDVS
jgi:hypothetical protein